MPGWLEEELDEAPAEDGVLGTGLTLEDLANGGGQYADMFKELLELRAEREAKAERERLAMEAQVALDAGNADLDDPGLRPMLIAMVVDRRAAADALYERGMRDVMRARGLPADEIEKAMAAERANAAAMREFLGPPSLAELPEWRAFQSAKAERARAAAAALDFQLRDELGFEADLEAASAGVQAALRNARTKGV